MKRNFSQQLIGLGGALMVEKVSPDAEAAPILLQHVCIGALLANLPIEQGITGEEKVKRFNLANRIHAGGEQDISAEDIALLKRLIGAAYPASMVGPAWAALEQDVPAEPPAG